MRLILTAALAAVLATGAAAQTPKPYLTAAIADPARGADRDRDARRKLPDLIAFTGAKPGDRVAELIPGYGYFSKVFSKVVGPTGKVYLIWPSEYAKVAQPDPQVNRGLAQQPAYRNITVIEQPGAAFATPEPVDVVFTSQNYHDYPDKFMGRIDPMVLNRAVYRSLKPGGVFVIVDHVAEAGSGMRDTDTLHRIDPAIVKKQVTAAGFVFEGESRVLRNAADNHKLDVFNKAIRGKTDQFVYRFRKPAARKG